MKLPKENMNWGIILKRIVFKFGGLIAGLALMVTALNVNTTCMFFAHQPKLPNGAEKLSKY